MIDPDLQKQLEAINTTLVEIKTKKTHGIWRAFFNGMFTALGYVAGLAIIILILGWILNITGLLPEFKRQVNDFQVMMGQAKQIINAGQNQGQQGSGQPIR